MIYENGSITLSSDEGTVTLSGEYTTPPVVTATLYDSNLNVTIKDITTTEFTIMLSDVPETTITVNYIVFGE
jgi:hypothetical protein